MEVIEMAPAQENPAAESAEKPPAFSGGVCSSILSLIITALATTWDKLKNLVKLKEPENAIIQNLEKQELSKAIYQVGVTLTVDLVALRRDKLEAVEQLMVVANATGCVLIFNGLMLRENTPTFATTAELVGVGIVFATIHLMFSIHLVWWLRIILAICCAFCIRPLIMAEVGAKNKKGNGVVTN
nr:uncharacterized protein LOC109153306 isoform X2 [Ipomoea batatas]